MNWKHSTEAELLAAYASLMEELRTRGIVRSSNNPVGDYAEGLVARALGLTQDGASNAGYDATDNKGQRFQIKGRRLTRHNSSTQLSAIRKLEKKPFDFLAAVMFASDFSIEYAAVIPLALVVELSKRQDHTNSNRLLFPRSLLADPRVKDITKKVKAAQQNAKASTR